METNQPGDLDADLDQEVAAAVRDATMACWAKAVIGLDEAAMASARQVGLPLFEAFVVGGDIALEDMMQVLEPEADVGCAGCGVTFRLGRGLTPYLPKVSCPSCGGSLALGLQVGEGTEGETDLTLPAAVESASDEISADGALESTALTEQAIRLWTISEAGADAVDAAIASGLPLIDALVLGEHVPLEALMAKVDPQAEVVCGACSQAWRLGRGLLEFATQLTCPACEAVELSPHGPVLEEPAQDSTFLDLEAESIPDSGALPVQRRFGPYQVLAPLGKGGMGEVYLAIGEDGVQVALKLLRRSLVSGERSLRRFEREAKALGLVEHENVVKLYGSGIDEETRRPYLATEYVRGGDLLSVAQGRPGRYLGVEETCYILAACVKGLEALHRAGVLHRDIKPSNVLLGDRGEVKLTDLGIALAEDVSVRLTVGGQVLGTPQYVAPEVVKGDDWSAAADVYALGSLAYRVLSGRPTFPGGSVVEVLNAQVTHTPPALGSVRSDVPAALAELVSEMLAKEPEERPILVEVLLKLERCGLIPNLERVPELWSEEFGDQKTMAPGSREIDQTLQKGMQFQSYLLEDELGRGGMGVVYRAHHTRLKKTVALKVLLSGAFAGEEEKRRFLREAEAVAALKHPFIVPVLDAGEHDGTHFITMDYVPGVPLNAWALAEERSLEEVLRVFAKVCEGLHHAHSRGIIHRDMKPDNVLVDEAGDPHILDFGIAKKNDADDPAAGVLTTQGDIIGTLHFMPPEQASGNAHDVDVRSDVYALGAVLFGLITGGKTVFEGNVHQLLTQILRDDPRAPSFSSPGLPWELDAVCLKALEKNRIDRYQSTIALKQDVEAFLEGRPIQARQASLGYRAKKFLRRNWRQVVACAAGLLIVSSFAGWVVWSKGEEERRHRSAILAKLNEAWSHWGVAEFAQAETSFSAAQELWSQLRRPDDPLELPENTTALLPPEVRARRERRHRITVDRLDDWRARASARKALAERDRRVGARVAAARRALSAGERDEAVREINLAKALKDSDPTVLALNSKLAGAFVEVGQDLIAASRARSRVDAEQFSRREQDLDRAQKAFFRATGLVARLPQARAGLDQVRDLKRELQEDIRNISAAREATRLLESARTRAAKAGIAADQQTPEGDKQAEVGYRASQQELLQALLKWKEIDGGLETLGRITIKLGDLFLRRDDLGAAQQERRNAETFHGNLVDLQRTAQAKALRRAIDAFKRRIERRRLALSSFASQLEQAKELFAAERFGEALRRYDLALQASTTPALQRERDLCASLAEATAARSSGKPKEERRSLLAAIKLSQDSRGLQTRVDALNETLYQQAVAQGHAAFAEAARRRQGWQVAITAYEEALHYRPRGVLAQRGWADAHAERDCPAGMLLVSVPLRLLAKGANVTRISEAAARRFYVDRHEVTNAEYARFVAAGGYSDRKLWSRAGWQARAAFVDATNKPGPAGWSDGKPKAGTEGLPVVGISGYEAQAFAVSRSCQLPSEEEWLLAALFDPSTGRYRRFPWGDEVAARDRQGLETLHLPGALRVDTSPWGARDMGFNASEWVVTRQAHPQLLVRGLSARFFAHDLGEGVLDWVKRPRPTYRSANLGFRCARPVKAPPPIREGRD